MELVFEAQRGELEKGVRLLRAQGMEARISRPKRQPGQLRVALKDAQKARGLLARQCQGRIISAGEAAWFRCYACGKELSQGEKVCLKCNAFVGDPHGL